MQCIVHGDVNSYYGDTLYVYDICSWCGKYPEDDITISDVSHSTQCDGNLYGDWWKIVGNT